MLAHPIDSLKVRMQNSTQIQQTVFRTMYRMLRNDGILSFYHGVLPPTTTKAFTAMLVFTTNNHLKRHLLTKKRNKYIQNNLNPPQGMVLSLSETFGIACACGLMVSPFKSCCELIKIQLQNDTLTSSRYRNVFDCTKRIIKKKAMHRGMTITTISAVPLWSVYLLVYDAWNRLFDTTAALGSNDTLSSVSVSARVMVGGILGGWGAWLVGYPLDYIKTHIQSHPIDNANVPTIRQVMAQTIQRFGYTGFYRGLLPCMIRSIPLNICTMWIYETVLHMRKQSQ
eukprot:144864_1